MGAETLDDMIKMDLEEGLSNKEWYNYTGHKIATKINKLPYFTLSQDTPLIAGLMIKDQEMLGRATAKVGEVLPLIEQDRAIQMLMELVRSPKAHAIMSVKGVLFESFGWGIIDITREINKDNEELWVNIINKTYQHLKSEGYHMIKVSYATGEIIKLDQLTVNELRNPVNKIDILKTEQIRRSK